MPFRFPARPHSARCLLLSLAACLTAGCGAQRDPKLPATVPVSGKVSLKGAPLEIGTITFHPDENSKGNPADGRLLAGGEFALSTYQSGDGAVLGKHKVTIQIPPRLDGEPPRPASLFVPKEYTAVQSTPLTAEVTEKGENHFEFTVEETKGK